MVWHHPHLLQLITHQVLQKFVKKRELPMQFALGLEQAIAQQPLGARLGAQLERCSQSNFPEVPNWEANPKRSPSPQKAHEV
jgi:hypothetical protein